MGSGRYDASIHASTSSAKLRDHGTTFAYDKMAKATGLRAAHATMAPTVVAGPASAFAGSVMRESCDSDEHPETLPIAVFFDVTGSMGHIPVVLQQKLPKLYALLLAKGYVEHPQVLFGAIGDATVDHVPLQVGQFESDNRADENLENLYLEGGGGGQTHESYEMAAYFVARHTSSDAWTKRGKKGYLFLIGDERAYKSVNRQQVKQFIGDDLAEDISTEALFDELRERWEVFFLHAEEGSYDAATIIHADGGAAGDLGIGWRKLVGQNALPLSDASAVCETIALAIGIGEGTVDLDAGLDDLRDVGSDDRAIESASRALAAVGASGAGGSADADGELPPGADDGVDRL